MNNYDTYFSVKRVYCLYRVSTLGQVEKDDIPMQKQRCREFAAAQGWSIVRELSEKGVSGFKVSAKDRDAIQEIQHDAVDGKFDILLVFMFDRLGQMTEAGLYTGGTVPYGHCLGFAAHSPSAYSSSVRRVKVSGRANIASFRKTG